MKRSQVRKSISISNALEIPDTFTCSTLHIIEQIHNCKLTIAIRYSIEKTGLRLRIIHNTAA